MVCFPCFVVPVALLFWRFLLWPLLRPLYVRWYGIPNDQQASDKHVEKLDKLGEDGCPFGCPMKPKDNSTTVAASATDEKKVL